MFEKLEFLVCETWENKTVRVRVTHENTVSKTARTTKGDDAMKDCYRCNSSGIYKACVCIKITVKNAEYKMLSYYYIKDI